VALNTVKAPARGAPQAGDGAAVPPVAEAISVLDATRAGTHALVAHLGADDLERVHSAIMGPLVWDLAHIAAYEDLWLCRRHGERDLLRPDLAALYDAFETPRAQRNDDGARLLDAAAADRYLDEVHERAREVLADVGVGDGTLFELVVRHELQHRETMRQTMKIAGLLPPGEPPQLAIPPAPGGAGGHEWLDVEAGPFAMGAEPWGFAYDNERPRHEAEVGAFAIARRPLSNGDWLRFCDEGGYERRELWSQPGWAWVEECRAEGGVPIWNTERGGREAAAECLCHMSWFEAEALARAQGARLPSEAEWEKAARFADGLTGAGLVWEWTSSEFRGYPGFRAHPYREYSEVFFERGYRVLRGSSWATDPRVASITFRNWDLPQRRQIFAGVRLAQDR
jgi:iron(II)-dependent oxidoreductase